MREEAVMCNRRLHPSEEGEEGERQTGNRGIHGERERRRRREPAERDKYLHPVVGEKERK